MHVITEQSVYRLADDLVFKNKLLLVPTAPVTSMREFVDAKTDEFAPKLLKILVTATSEWLVRRAASSLAQQN